MAMTGSQDRPDTVPCPGVNASLFAAGRSSVNSGKSGPIDRYELAQTSAIDPFLPVVIF
jgi:hypothetical protein